MTRYILLTIGVAAFLWAGRTWQRLNRSRVSKTWRDDQRHHGHDEFMGPSHEGKWNR